MEKTIIADWLHQDRVGYWVGFFLSEESQKTITELLADVSRELPGVLWTMPANRLHVTLFEIIMPLREYPEDKDKLYATHKEEIESNLQELFSEQPPITVRFDALEASAQTIIVKGTDDGSFQRLRSMATTKPIIQPGSRVPPDIIHSSLARYTKSVELDVVQRAVAGHSVSFQENITAFNLSRVYKTPMDSETLRVYPLKT